MKKVLTAVFLVISLGAMSQQPPKRETINIPLTVNQLQVLIKIIDDSKNDGDSRREIIKWLAEPANAFLAKQQPQKQDTTKPKVVDKPKQQGKN